MDGFLLDTNIFNHLVEEKIVREDLPFEFPIFVTHLQYSEISECPNEEKKVWLMSWLRVLPDDYIPLETFVLGVSAVEDRLGDGALFSKLLLELNQKQKRKNNANVNDALLGEVAIKTGMVLITNDQILKEIVTSNGGLVRSICSGFDLI